MTEQDELNMPSVEEETETGADQGLVQCYEVGFHLPAGLSDTQITEEVEKLHRTIEKEGGSIIAEGRPEFIDLAYPMQGQKTKDWFTQAHFGWVKFELPRVNAPVLAKELADDASFIRFLIVAASRDVTIPFRKAVRVAEKQEKKVAPAAEPEEKAEVSEEELDKAVDALVNA